MLEGVQTSLGLGEEQATRGEKVVHNQPGVEEDLEEDDGRWY
jgi:hypothetical protein